MEEEFGTGTASLNGLWLDRMLEIRYFCVIMVKKFLVLAMLVAAITSINAQDLTFGKGKEHEFTITPTGPDDCAMYITNNSGKSMVISYEKISADVPSNWIITFCDNVNCYGTLITGDTFSVIKANETVNLKVSVMSMAKADTAFVQYAVWNKYGNAAVKDTLTWKIYMPRSAGNEYLPAVVTAVYPNPTTDYVVLPPSAQHITVADASGKLMTAARISQGILHLDALPAGVYTLRFKIQGVETSQSLIRK